MNRRLALFLIASFTTSANAQDLRPPAGQPPSIVPSSDPLSPEDLTEGISVITCHVEGIDGQRYNFAIRYVGGRGYLDPTTNEVASTDGSVSVLKDEAALLSGYARWFERGNAFEAFSEQKDAALGPRLRLSLERTEFPSDSGAPVRWAVLVQAYADWMPLTKATGFCDEERTPQQPLSETETRAYLQR